jgi:hypothetical protein
MGKQQAFISLLNSVTGGAGFAHRVPETEREFDSAVVEGTLLLNVVLGSMQVRTVDDFVAACRASFKDVVAFTGARKLFICFDNREEVSKAKRALQQKRTESASKSVEKKGLKPYTDDELAAFLQRADDTAALKATHAELPSLERLRVSKGGGAVLERATRFMVDALKTTPFVVPDEGGSGTLCAIGKVELIIVRNGVVEHGHQRAELGSDAPEPPLHWQALEHDGERAPVGVAEAEELVAHYAVGEWSGARVFARCSDTDIVPVLACAVRRLRGSPHKQRIWLDLNQGRSLENAFGAEPPADDQKKRKNDYPRCV